MRLVRYEGGQISELSDMMVDGNEGDQISQWLVMRLMIYESDQICVFPDMSLIRY